MTNLSPIRPLNPYYRTFDSDGNPRETYIKALAERRARLQTIDEEGESFETSSPAKGKCPRKSMRMESQKPSTRRQSTSGFMDILDSLISTGDGSTKSNKILWFISLLWFVSCGLGLIHQVKTISEGYFRYSVTTETAIQIAAKVKPPAMSLCFYLVDARIRNEFSADSTCYRKYLDKDTHKDDRQSCLEDFRNLSMRSIKKRTLEFDDLVEELWYREPETYEEVFLNRTDGETGFFDYVDKHVSTVIKGDLLCYRVRPLVNYTSDEYNSFVINDNKNQGAILSLYFNLSAMGDSHLGLYMHLPAEYPRGYLISPLIYNVTGTHRFVASYRKIVNNFLPPPFASACHDYAANTEHYYYKNQKECVEFCLDNSTSDPQNFVYPTTVKYEFDHKKIEMEAKDITVRIACFQKCPVNCRDVTFYPQKQIRSDHPVIVPKWILEKPQPKNSILSLAASEPEITVTFNARTELFEYIIYIASCFSLWFGGAVYSSTLSILFMSTTLFQKYLGVKKFNQEERRKSQALLLGGSESMERRRSSEWTLQQPPPATSSWDKLKSSVLNTAIKQFQSLKQRTKSLINNTL